MGGENSWHDAGLSVYWAWQRFVSSPDPVLRANAIIKLSDAISDLSTWLPGYDYETGTIDE